jgi:hypothetical protein
MDESVYSEIVAGLRAENVKAVVFDFDCTISLKHSGGRVRKDKFEAFLQNNLSPCFQYILPRLLKDGYLVGVATFADSYMAPATHIAGEDLVRAFFRHHFQDDFADRIPIIAAYPGQFSLCPPYRPLHSKGTNGPSQSFILTAIKASLSSSPNRSLHSSRVRICSFVIHMVLKRQRRILLRNVRQHFGTRFDNSCGQQNIQHAHDIETPSSVPDPSAYTYARAPHA